MNNEEKKEYVQNIFELVLTGTEENYLIAESLISSLNLYDDFVNHAEKEIKVLRVKKSFIESRYFSNNATQNQVFENVQKAAEIGSDIMIIKSFLSDIKNKKPQQNEGA